MRMDPDHQVDAAADTRAYAGGCGGLGGDESWARALLRRRWDLSRKAALAGVAATAAPVLAPSVIILSIAGVALSIPFAACLASLAATDRLMGALLCSTPPQQPYNHTYDLGDTQEPEQEFVDASEAPPHQEEAPVFGHWSKAEEDTIVEQNERLGSLPLSLELRLSEELVPVLANEQGDSAEGEFAIPTSGHELFAQRDGEHKQNNDTATEADSEYTSMEAPSPADVSVLEAPVLLCEEDDNISREMDDAQVPAEESVQELSVSDNGNKTEDGTATTAVDVSCKEMQSPLPGVDAYATGLGNLGMPMLGNEYDMILREGEGGVSVQIEGHDSHVSDSGNETEQHKTVEIMPQHEINVSESPVPVLSKLEQYPAVEMALQEVMRDTNPVTGYRADVQLDVTATAEPQSESLHSRCEAAHELQEVTEPLHLGSNLSEGIAKGTDKKTEEGGEQYGRGDVPIMVPVDDDKDLISSRSRQNVSSISDGTTSVGSKLDADHPNKKAGVANKEYGKEKLVEDKGLKTVESETLDDKVPNTDMAAQDVHISKSVLQDYRSTIEDEVTVEMVLEEVTSRIDPVTGEVVEVQVDIIARESESRPMSDLVDKDLQVVIDAGTVGDKTEDNMKGISNTKVVDVEHEIGGGSSSVVTVTSVLTMDGGEDLMSSGSTAYVSAISDDKISVEGKPDVEHHHQTTGVGYKNRELKREMLVEEKDTYTEVQLREQLDTLRTITGYHGMPSLTLEGELDGLYIFVGVEPPPGSGDDSSLTELSTKLRFLKSIIGLE